MKICVIGLGKIGLPLAAQYASKGFRVIGCDINPEVVDSINRGISHIRGEPGLDERIGDSVKKGLLSATTDTVKAVRESDVIVVIVPLVVDKEGNIDYSTIDSVTETISKGLKRDSLVIYETTLPVGDTRDRMIPILERSGLKAGRDFYVVFSPERVSSGVMFRYLREIPKIVGGIDEESTRRGVEFYKRVLDSEVISVTSSEAAEATKLFGMVYRDVNIALANEFARFCQARGLDVVEIIGASNTNPHSHILTPGIGVGGHCAPVYPYFLIKNASDLEIDLILAKNARRINDGMPEHAVNLLGKELKDLDGKNVLILGIAYRGGVKETFLSPSLSVIEHLKDRGANVYVNDPLFSKEEIEKLGVEFADLKNLNALDAVILVTDHKEYKNLDLKNLREKGVKVIVDGRNFLEKEKIEKHGIIYRGIGRS
ncbi:MAG: nucleotide sugar dehydrogenase [Candidatus Altiarchaeales archaeon]|nr:MAG: nucleotide sugar dehydrogenase [Candidatus Altiarchaeales archaeon]